MRGSNTGTLAAQCFRRGEAYWLREGAKIHYWCSMYRLSTVVLFVLLLLASAGCKDPPLAVLLLLRKHTEALAKKGCKDLLLALLLLLRQHRGGLLA